jgi:outer membrane protein insertion porin family
MLGRRWSVGITLSIDHSFLQNVLQDFLPPVFSDADWAAGIAAPDPFVTYQDYLAAIAQGDTIPVQYMMKYDAYDFSIGFTTGYRYRTSLGWLGIKGGYTPDFRYIDYDNSLFRPFEKTVRDNWRRISLIDKVFFGISLDGRDIYWNPTTGYYVGQNIGFTGGILLGDRHYIRTDTTVEGFLTLIDMPVLDNWNLTWVLAAHSSVSLIMPQLVVPSLKWQTVTDFTDLLYIDGMTVGRGWRQLYGKALWDNKVELRTPLAKDIVWAVGFFDAAALWDVPWKANASDPGTSMTAMNIDQFYFSIGFGLRFTIPQFPIRLYLAKGFQIKPNDPAGPVVWKTGDLSIGGFSFGFVISLGGDLITGTAF